jgi:hypothetical protein
LVLLKSSGSLAIAVAMRAPRLAKGSDPAGIDVRAREMLVEIALDPTQALKHASVATITAHENRR